MKSFIYISVAAMCLMACSGGTADTSWPETKPETKPWIRWWWLGSAVDKENLTWGMEEISKQGLGGVEITPIYGVKGKEALDIPYLSPQWMEMLKHSQAEGKRLGLTVDMNGGTGWPFGGPDIRTDDAATRALFHHYKLKGGEKLKDRIVPAKNQAGVAVLSVVMAYGPDGQKTDITDKLATNGTLDWTAPEGEWLIVALFNGKTKQMVKRAAPGGEGYVMNHYSKTALEHYLKRFDDAFSQSGTAYPHSFFNDSYEVYGADWSDNLFTEFETRRGYKLQDYLPELLRLTDNKELCARVVADYRETVSDMLLFNFTIPWTEWAHGKGSTTRNQAHGSPGNLIDLYAAMDIPECESFGRTKFDIPALRVDSGMLNNMSDPTVLMYASSAAHIAGKPYASSETFTWLTEHFRTSLSQCKPEVDLLFLSGVNHVLFHGSPYTPKDAPWPGWLFYASVNFSPNNTIWRDLNGMTAYITRCQSFLQQGKPDNQVLLYLPIHDIWYQREGLFLPFEIGRLQYALPEFFDAVSVIRNNGYDMDYISDRFVAQAAVRNGKICLPGGEYQTLVVPSCQMMPVETMTKLNELAKQGATIIYSGNLPKDVPGLGNLETRQQALKTLLADIPAEASDFSAEKKVPYNRGAITVGKDISKLLALSGAPQELMVPDFGIRYIRRSHDAGSIYFISVLDNKTIDGWVPLSAAAKSAMIFDPVTGESGKAHIRKNSGKTEIYLQLHPGESKVIKTYSKAKVSVAEMPLYKKGTPVVLSGNWTFGFTEGIPAIEGKFDMRGDPVSWTTVAHDSAQVYAGTGRYALTFDLPRVNADDWQLDFGLLAESARITINGQQAGLVWSIPYTANVGKYLKAGQNTIEIDVTNLPANRIRDYDKRGVNWRIFKDINIVSVFYKDIRFDTWDVQPSGLIQPVNLVPLTNFIP